MSDELTVRPRTAFEWAIYADATLAGLSHLIPIPFLDDVSERFFRKRIPRAVARARGRELEPAVAAELSQGEGCMGGCLMLPVTLTVGLLKRLSRKLLYFLTVKKATESLSEYWHRAFLIDYMLAAGHLEDADSARVARQAMERVLDSTAGPLNQAAKQVVSGTHHAWRSIRRARQGGEDEEIEQTRSALGRRWADFAGYLEGVAARYDETYRAMTAGEVLADG